MALRGTGQGLETLKRLIASLTPEECSEWPMAKNSQGYGAVHYENRQYRAHRLAFEFAFGPPKRGEVIRHRCDNPGCVNPHHLRAGSTKDNVHDRVRRKRGACGERHPKSKLTKKQVLFIRRCNLSTATLAAKYGVSYQAIRYVRQGKVWKSAGGLRR